MRNLLSTLLYGGLTLTMAAGSAALAQAPGGGAGQSQPSMSRPSSTIDPNNPATPGNTPDATSTKVDDKKFAREAAIGGMFEVELGKLALQKASSDPVKQFAQKMVDDHTKAGDQLKEVAGKDSITLPDALDSKHQARIDKLSKLSGPQFDRAYVKDQLKDHQQDVREFQSEAQNGSDPNIKQFASTTLPVLQEHLSMVKDLNKTEK